MGRLFQLAPIPKQPSRPSRSPCLYHFRFKMIKWQNGFLGVRKAAALGWARGPGKRSERRSRLKAICPNALRCFQNELHHFIILNLKWY